jgi:uncharacterized peroxidase-related enzyme
LTIPSRVEAPLDSQPILDAVNNQLGVVPNLYRVVSHSPAALTGMTRLEAALSKALDLKTRTRIAVAIAQVNGCDYCLSAHTYLGLNLAKISPDEIALNRKAVSSNLKADAAVRFAAKVAQTRGKVTGADIAAVKMAGFGEAEIIEIIAVVALNVMTNLINNVTETDIDFPVIHTADAA